MRSLLDVNVLIALLDAGHMHHARATGWLEQAMLKFVHNPDLAARMGLRARQVAEDKYDVHKVNAVMLREMGIA